MNSLVLETQPTQTPHLHRRFDSHSSTQDRATRESSQSLRQRVRSALSHSNYAPLRRLDIVAASGKVRLRGEVGSWHLKQLAQEVLLHLDGVGSIENDIAVCPQSTGSCDCRGTHAGETENGKSRND